MIHSPGSMPTGNFEEPVVSSEQPPERQRSFRLPADYYSAPLSEVKPFFPAWVPWGCGSVAALVLLVMFAAGALMTDSRLAAVIDLVLGTSIAEVKRMYVADVTEPQKQAFDAAVESMREGLREGNVTVEKVQPFLQAMQKSIGDEKVTAAELKGMTDIAANAAKSR
jgi:hypothetical protein